MEKVKAYIAREQDGTYSIFTDAKAPINYGLIGEGATVEEAIDEWNRMYEGMKASYAKDGIPFVEAEFTYVYDVASFLAYYGSLISFKGLSRLTGISAAQLSQYATGYRNPSPKTTARIQEGLHTLAKELSQVSLV
ncbi:MAG: helix-turn-helix domain-containing protein [Muribaculaceae bacterium]|nr:helix-turn-helix domain-containing protein [Muribaculaceae bacterium]